MKTLRTLTAIAALTWIYQPSALADSIEAKVIKASSESSRIIVQTTDAELITKGEVLEFGSRCALEVIGTSSNKIILSTKDCQNTKALKVGNTVALEMDSKENNWNSNTVKSSGSVNSTSASSAKISARPTNPFVVSRGIRVGFAKPNLDSELKVTVAGFGSDTVKDDSDAKFNINVGYANVGVNRIGVLTSLNHTNHDADEGDDIKAVRLEGSAAYGFAKNFYSFGGLNLNKFTNSEIKELDPQLGFQLGAGVQLTENMGIDLKYVETNNKGDVSIDDGLMGSVNVDAEVKLKGIELGLHATF